MSCKPTYKGVRYNSLEELYNANGVNEQQKQKAQQLYSQYLSQNPNGSVEQFKSWVDNNQSSEQSNDSVTNINTEQNVKNLSDSNSEKSIIFAELDESIKKVLLKRGFTESSWNNLSTKVKEHEINCLK